MSHLQKNLDASEKWTPGTAAIIAAAATHPDFKPTQGSDSAETYLCVHSNPPRLEWLGHTSMPTASAGPLIQSLDTGTGNGLGLSIGTAHEWLAFVRKLGSAQAIFVYEPDPTLLRMALDICDLSEFLADGKIVLLTGSTEAAGGELCTFLADHVGYEPPTVLQPLATISPERRNGLLAAGEILVRRAVVERQAVTHALAARVEAAMFNLTDATLLFAITPRYAAERPMIACSSNAAETIFIDHHAATSVAHRLKVIADQRPRTIVSDLFRDQIACVPYTIAVETWIPPLVGAAFWRRLPSASTLTPADRIVVHSAYHIDRLTDHGIPVAQIDQRVLQRSDAARRLSTTAERSRVAIIADLPSVDPKGMGIELPTHLAVFSAASELIAEDFLTVYPGVSSDILRRALARANVGSTADGATDPALRSPFLQIIRDVLIPAVPLLTLARHLIGQRIPLRLIGDWQGLDAPADIATLEAFPCRPEESVHWDDVACLVHLSPTGTLSPLVLDAVAMQIPVIAPQHPTDGNFGALATLLIPEKQFANPTAKQFFATLKSLMRNPVRQERLR